MKEDTTLKALLEKHPCRKVEHHARVQLDYKKTGVCVVCSVLYLQKKKSGDNVNYQKDVKMTGKVCGWCNRISSQKMLGSCVKITLMSSMIYDGQHTFKKLKISTSICMYSI